MICVYVRVYLCVYFEHTEYLVYLLFFIIIYIYICLIIIVFRKHNNIKIQEEILQKIYEYIYEYIFYSK